jgi:2-alkyl-3-oxoalkanoate reductase
MKVFLAGATGVAGRRALRRLIGAGHAVTALVRTEEKAEWVHGQGADPVLVDLFDFLDVRRATAGHHAVVNLTTHIPTGWRALLTRAWRENDRIRRDAARNLVDAALANNVECYVQESTTMVYPDRGEEWIDERSALTPAQFNQTVRDAEEQARRFTAAGRRAIVLRFALFYGADSRHTVDSARMIRAGYAPAFGARDAYISSISTDDVATAVAYALKAPAGTYNICDDEPLRTIDYVNGLANLMHMGRPRLPPRFLVRLLGAGGELLSRSQRVSNRRFKGATGWQPRFRNAIEGWREAVLPALLESLT